MVHLDDLDILTARPSLDIGLIDIIDETDIRSPRTPIYLPTFPFSSILGPFDPAKLFSNLSVPLAPKAIALTKKTLPPPPPPSDPLAWVWQCHLCRSKWALGVTRRCLVDGHLYCSGEASQPNLKKKRKGQSCSSEFDYVGWKDWSAWKRNALKTMLNPRIPKGCEKCEFPSQCRYGPAENKLIDGQPGSSPMAGVEFTSTNAEEDAARYYSNENVTLDSILANAEVACNSVQSKMTDFYKANLTWTKSSEQRRPKPDKVAKSAERRPSKKPTLPPIEEEALRNEGEIGLQELVMPVVDFCSDITKD